MNVRKSWHKAVSTTIIVVVILVIIIVAGVAAYVALTPSSTTSSTSTSTTLSGSTSTFSSSSSTHPVTVNVISFDQGLVWTDLWNATTGAPLAPLLSFEQKNNIIINVEFDDEATVREKVQADMSTGTGHYDITLADSSNLVDVYDNAGMLYPLNDFFTPGNSMYTPSPYFNYSDFLPKTISMLSLGDKLYALPYFTFAAALMYRADLLQKYSVSVPTTMDQLWNVTLPALKAGMQGDGTLGTVYPVALRGEPKETTALDVNAVFSGLGVCWFQGCYWNKTDIIANKALPDFNSTKAVEAINDYAILGKTYSTADTPSYDFSKAISLYQAGKAAILFPSSVNGFVAVDGATPAIASQMKFVPMVVGPTGQSLDQLWSLSFGISEATHNPQQAWLALTFLTGHDEQLNFATNFFPNPSLLSVLNSPQLTQKWGAATMQTMITGLNDANPHFIPNIPETNAIMVEIGVVTSAVMSGQMTAQQAGQTLQNFAYTLLYGDGYY